MDRDFVRIVDAKNQLIRIINIRQIVQVHQPNSVSWTVVLTSGDDIVLDTSEAEALLKRLPGATPAVAGPIT